MLWNIMYDHRCPYVWNDITEIVAEYDKWEELGEWGPKAEFGYLLRHRRIGLVFLRLFCDLPAPGYGRGDWTPIYTTVSEQPTGFNLRPIGISR